MEIRFPSLQPAHYIAVGAGIVILIAAILTDRKRVVEFWGEIVVIIGLLSFGVFVQSTPDTIAFLVIAIIGIVFELRAMRSRGTSVLAKKTSRELRQIAARYQVPITGKAGNTWGRVVFYFLLFWGLGRLLYWATAFVPLPMEIRLTLVTGMTAFAMVVTLPWFIVSVPKLAFIVTTNFFTGRMHILIPGLNFRYPWELYNRGRLVATEAEREQEHSDVLSQRAGEIRRTEARFLTKDGIGAILPNLIAQWGPFLPLGPLNIRFEQQDLSDTVGEIVESTLFQEITTRNVEELRNKAAIDAIEDALVDALGASESGSHQIDKLGSTIQERCGIVFEMPALGMMKFDNDYEQSLRANVTLGLMKEQAKSLRADLNMDGDEAFNAVMIVNKEEVKKNIIGVEMSKGSRGAVDALSAGVKSAVTAVARTISKTTP